MVFRNLFQCLQQHCIELLEAWNCVRIVFIYKVQEVDAEKITAVKDVNFMNSLSAEWIAERYILLENFENGLAESCGGPWRDRYGNTSMRSVEGMARWTPLIDGVPVRKGGWGAYKRKKGLVKDLFKPMSNGASRANAHITT